MTGIALKVKRFFSTGHERTLKAKKNIAISFFLRGINIAVGFILIPMTITYVDPVQYGIWLTLSSVIAWFSFFDIGLGNGLKNKLAEANAVGDYENAKIYVSTTYAILAIIAFSVLIIFTVVNKFISWGKILNTNIISESDLKLLALLVIAFFCVRFVVQLIDIVLTANHQPSMVSLIGTISQIVICIAIFILTKTTKGSLIKLVMILGGIPVLVKFLSSIWFYLKGYRRYTPSIKSIDFKHSRSLLLVGGVFFILQMGALILFQTDNIVITQLFGPRQVTVFNVAYKLFSATMMIFSIIVTPLWSAFTDAYKKNDFVWIKQILKRMEKIWVILSVATLVLLIFSPYIFKLWLNNTVKVPFVVSTVMAIQVIVLCRQTIYNYFLNGIGKLRLQLLLVTVGAVINLPLAILLGKWMGVAGVTLSNVIVISFLGIMFSIQCKRIIKNTAKGIWNK